MNKINATSGAHVPEEVKKAYEEKFQQHADKLISIRVKLEDLQAREAQQEADLKRCKDSRYPSEEGCRRLARRSQGLQAYLSSCGSIDNGSSKQC